MTIYEKLYDESLSGCAAHIHAFRFVCIPTSFKFRNHVQIQTKCKIIVISRPFALSNGALGFPVS